MAQEISYNRDSRDGVDDREVARILNIDDSFCYGPDFNQQCLNKVEQRNLTAKSRSLMAKGVNALEAEKQAKAYAASQKKKALAQLKEEEKSRGFGKSKYTS
jgi:hypothetical protein